MDSFPLTEPMIQGSPAIGFELDDLLTLDPDAFNDLIPFNDKSMDLYDLNACLAAEWRIHSPATSTSSDSFSDCHAPSSLAEIPVMVSLKHQPVEPNLIG